MYGLEDELILPADEIEVELRDEIVGDAVTQIAAADSAMQVQLVTPQSLGRLARTEALADSRKQLLSDGQNGGVSSPGKLVSPRLLEQLGGGSPRGECSPVAAGLALVRLSPRNAQSPGRHSPRPANVQKELSLEIDA